jgi:surface antigen
MPLTRHSCKTTSLAAALTALLIAGPLQTASAQDARFGFYIGARDGVGNWQHHKNYRRAYPRRYFAGPRYYPSYSHRIHYGPGWDYSITYHLDSGRYARNHDRFIAATGVFFGVLVGSELLRYMNNVDRLRARDANLMAQTAPIGQRIVWNNPESNNAGSVIPTRDGYSESGKYCREFYQTVSIGGRVQDAYGVACQQADGAWQIVR